MPENVHVMNILDSAPASTRALEQLAMADNNLLDSIPGGMFDWGRWDEFFSRLNPPGNTQAMTAAVLSAGLPQPCTSVVTAQGGESVAMEQGQETSENCSLPVPASS